MHPNAEAVLAFIAAWNRRDLERVMGIFQIEEGRISAWPDYFYLGQFNRQMAG